MCDTDEISVSLHSNVVLEARAALYAQVLSGRSL